MSAEQDTRMGSAHPNDEGGTHGQKGVEASLDRKGSLLRVTLQDVQETTRSSDGVFERQLLLELHNKTHFTAAELDAMIRHFREDSIAGSDQYVDRESFQQYLGHAFGEQDEELMDHLFFAMDRQQQGRVKVKHLVMALSTIFRGGEDEVLEFWFKMYDADQNGRLTKAEFESLLNDVNGTMKKNLALEMEVLYGEEDSDEGQPVELDMEEFKHIMGGLGVLPSFMSPHKASSDSQTILFRDFTPSEREVLSLLGSVRKLQHGDYIIREKDRQCRFFLITQGIVELSRGGIRLQVQEEGEFLGEAALFDDVKTLHSDGSVKFTTSAKVVSPEAMVLEMHIKDFYQLVYHEHPGATQIVQRLGRVMMERFEQTEERLQSLLASSPHQSQAGMRLSSKDWQQFRQRLTRLWSLRYHKIGRKGKLEILPTKQMGSKQDLSVAYSPGVAEPCLSIKKDAEWAFEYTAKGHLVGVITNGTAVLGLGDIGPLAAKPVMEGKHVEVLLGTLGDVQAVLFKKFADIDAFDLELDCKDPERLVDHVVALGPSFGGINLEDIKAPECFMVERECQRRLTIPVFHDDQHGTAIIAGAGLINALQLVDKEIDSIKVVVCGVGAAGFTCAKYFVALGVLPENLYAVDLKGVVYKGREDLEEPDNYLKEVANDTPLRTLEEAVAGADVFLGLSAGGLLKPEMLQSMERDPIVFACANPIPEIDPVTAKQTRPDVIIATGRSDFPNQINNVCAFPYIFRGALDCRARAVNEQMKLAATKAIASLVHTPMNTMKRSLSTQSMSDEQRRRHRRSNTMGPGLDDDEQQPQQELAADDSLSLSMRTMKLDPVFDRDYIIPKPFDERLIVEVSCAVVEAAITSGVARRKDMDLQSYRAFLMDLTTKQAI